jgi:hypothetical protein
MSNQKGNQNEHQTKSSLAMVVSPELANWLRDARLDAEEVEETNAAPTVPAEDYPLETAGLDPFEFQLANGHNVKIVYARFWERIRYQDWREGARPAKYRAIKVYCTEDTLPRSMAIHCEFRAGKEFALPTVPKIWDWLDELIQSRRFAEFDAVTEFIDELADQLIALSYAGGDAVEHFDHLSEISQPEFFDKVDDSLFNDQSDSETTGTD